MGKREAAALTLYFLNPFPASALPTCQALRRGNAAGRSSHPSLSGSGLSARAKRWPLSLSPFPHPYIALFPSLVDPSAVGLATSTQATIDARQAGLPACRPRCAKRGSGKERKAASEGDGASAEKGAFPLCRYSCGPARKRLLSPTVAAILFLPGRELWRCYGLFTFFGRGSRKRPR